MKREKLIEELIKLCHDMADKIKISHGGWHDSYATTNERKLIKLSEELREVQDG